MSRSPGPCPVTPSDVAARSFHNRAPCWRAIDDIALFEAGPRRRGGNCRIEASSDIDPPRADEAGSLTHGGGIRLAPCVMTFTVPRLGGLGPLGGSGCGATSETMPVWKFMTNTIDAAAVLPS